MKNKPIILSLALWLVPSLSAFAQTFTKITTGAIVNDVGWSQGSSWGDYDNDGDLDLFVANNNQNNFLYQNNGDGTFTKITSGAIVNDGGDSHGSSWGDYDNDGDLDLFVANYNQNNFLYQNNGDGTFTKITSGAIVNDGGDSRGSSWGDYDNDGDLDLFVANTSGQNNFLYQNNGDGTFTKITSGEIVNDGGYSNGASWGDYDTDGDLDLFVANDLGENNFLYRNNGNRNNWINIRLLGTVSNTAAIGAKVKVKATIKGKPVWQMQEISGQTGFSSQSGLNAEFGLGDATVIDSIKVEWPSGIVQDSINVAINQSLTIAETPFTRITSGAIVNDGGNSRGSSWGDYDNDGDLDLFVANYNQNNFFYQNNGDGTFTKITSGAIVNDGGASLGSSWGDYDNDSDLDLFVANDFDENNFLYQNNGDGSFTKIASGAIVNDGGSSRGSSWGDYDNDGNLDLFVTNYNENNFLYQNNGDGNFTKITSGAIVNDGGNSRGSSWGDYDNDGDLDLFVANFGENNFLYQNNGDDTFTKITSGSIVNDGGFSYGGSWGDYDNHGDLDLFVANYFNQNNFLYRNDGDGSFTKITSGAIVNDGGHSLSSSWGDYDNDGDLDLFVANDNNQNNFLYQNNGNGNNWIDIRLIGTVSNTAAIGAKVKVRAIIKGKPVWQMQEVSGQTGYASQNSLNAEFGLKKAAIVDSIQIRWPSGAVNGYANVKVNQFLTLRENNRPRLIDENDIPDTTLSSASPVFLRNLREAPVLFRDRDGDRLTFSATSSDPNIAQASMAGSILTVTLVDTAALGQARITVKADDGRADDGRGNPDFTRFEINRAPFLRQALPDTTLLVDGPRLRINLDQKFVDPEGDLLEFQTGSRYDTVATAVVSDRNRLFIYQEGLGETVIHATALDNRGGKTRIDFGLKITKSRAPEIVHQNIAVSKVSQDIPIVAQILDDENAVAFAALKFRPGGSSGLVSLLMDSVRGQNNLFRATIPGAAVTERGVEYAIEATDIHRESSSEPNADAFFSVRVRVDVGVTNKRPQPFGGEQKSYHLFSIPLEVDKKKSI